MKLANLLKAAVIERQVEDAYNKAIEKAFPGAKLEYPFACDGYCEFKVGDNKKTVHRLLIEYKYDEDMSSKTVRSKVLTQVLGYMKKFEENGRHLPSVVLVADKNECFVLHVNDLVKWLDFDGVKWDGAPSAMAGANPNLVLALAEDETRNAFVYDVDDSFDFETVAQKIRDMATGTVRLVRVTEHNVDQIFKVFSEKIVKDKKYPPNDMVALFFNVVTGSDDVYLHPVKKDTLVVNGKNVKIDAGKFKAFCGHFSTTCSPKEKARLAAISDRLIEDTNRRRKGEFYTPTPFVDYSHAMICKQFGDDWKEKYYVWDCAAGTLNLTRDYKFSHLFSSTLEQAELDIAKNYNNEAAKFQFDFLNDELKKVSEGGKVPDALIEALEQNKPIIFYINPPYGMNGSNKRDGSSKTSICKTAINAEMCAAKIGKCSQELITQFLYRILNITNKFNLTNSNIALFSNPKFFITQGAKKFRTLFFDKFNYRDGIYFNAGHFGNVSGTWGITFNIWKAGQCLDKTNFMHKVVDIIDGEIITIQDKLLYNIDNDRPLNEYHEFNSTCKTKVELPGFSNALTIGNHLLKVNKDSFGYLYLDGYDAKGIMCMPYSHGHGHEINANNYEQSCTTLAALLLGSHTWIEEKDPFIYPNIQHPKYSEFISDAIIWSTFGCLQASLHQVSYHNKLWDIKNEFFWCKPKDIAAWANACNNDEVYNDANTMPESFVCKKLQGIMLSTEAQAVLDKANELLEKSMKYRKIFNDEHPEVQIQNADAGWYQVKQLLKVYMPNELKEFNELYKKLADKMKPMVKTLGFLK